VEYSATTIERRRRRSFEFSDTTACDYFGAAAAEHLRAVGWLERGQPFATGAVSTDAYVALQQLLMEPWQPVVFCGMHQCDLCQFDGPMQSRNLFLPAGDSIFVAPAMIAHYIAAHHYRSPDAFLAVVISIAPLSRQDYLLSVLRSGGGTLIKPPKGTAT
jgi:hypothetical protein